MRGWAAGLRDGGVAALLMLWLLVPLLVFSLAHSRRSLYVLPLYVPIALGIARGLATAPAHGYLPVPSRAVRLAVASTVVLLLLKVIAAQVPSRNDMRALAIELGAVAGSHADVWLFEESKMFGLDFYRSGRVRRASRSGAEPWADASLHSVLRSVVSGQTDAEALVVSPLWSDSLRTSLERERVLWRRVSLQGRDLYLVGSAGLEAETAERPLGPAVGTDVPRGRAGGVGALAP